MDFRRASALIVTFAVLSLQCASAADLKIVLLHSKTGRPVHRKKFCISFSRNPKMSALDRPDAPEVCRRTDSSGTISVALPDDPRIVWTYVHSLTNDFVPCLKPQAFSTTELTQTGVIVPNTCGPDRTDLRPQPGTLIFYGHQMSFSEVLKSMRGELP
jgi:hypothetical protein